MLKNIPVLVIFISYLALMGCGTKGPLYIPEQRYPQGAENNSAPKDVKLHAPRTSTHVLYRAYL